MRYSRLSDGHKTKEIFDLDQPNILLLQLSLVGEKSHYIHLVDLVFFTRGNKQSGPLGFSRKDRDSRQLDGRRLFPDIWRQALLWRQDENGRTTGIHPGRSAIAMG